MKIRVKESSIVRPAEDIPRRRMWLSNLDLVQGNYHLPAVYFYKFDGSSNFFDLKLLKESLSKVLVPFYPIAGRYARDESGRMEIDCNGEGVLFAEAEADCPMSYFNDFTPWWEFLELAPRLECSPDDITSFLLLIQITRFSCNGVCLGIASHHQVVDGQATTHFTNSWSEITRGLSITVPPVHERNLLRPREPPTPEFYHIEYDPNPKFKPQNIEYRSEKEELQNIEERPSVAIFKLPADFVNSLRAKMMKNEENNVKYSSFEILSAHIWRCAAKATNLSNDQPNMLMMPADGRHRLDPPLPNGYFGNAIFTATTMCSTGEIISESPTKTAERIKKAVNQVNNDYLRSCNDYLEERNRSNKPIHLVEPTLRINSWLRLPLACTDFGWGKTTFMRPTLGVAGVIILLPSFAGDTDGNWSMFACLHEDHIKPFQKFLYEF